MKIPANTHVNELEVDPTAKSPETEAQAKSSTAAPRETLSQDSSQATLTFLSLGSRMTE